MNLPSYQACTLCPRKCRIDRSRQTGYCGCSDQLKAARAALHKWEEPCLSGPEWAPGGSGTVFFSGCTLLCCFCQNYHISSEHFGKELTSDQLADIFLRLQDQGAYNINLVTPTQYLPSILPALDKVRSRLSIPVICNCSGYERSEVTALLKDYIDIWLPDLKYHDRALSARLSKAPDYFENASAAILQMIRQTGAPVFEEQASEDNAHPSFMLMKKGVILRHMVLPGHRDDSISLMHWIHDTLPKGQYLLSILSQYTPCYHSSDYPELNRRITSYEYGKVVDAAIDLGLTQGFMQKKSSAKEEYTPPFDLEGL